MIDVNPESEVSMGLLKVLAEVQLWESSNVPMLQTVAGRQLYFGLIRHMNEQKEKGLAVESMKEIYYDKGISLTERGVRLTVRAFEDEGALYVDKATKDRRARRILLTEKLQMQMLDHALIVKKTIENEFLVIKK